MLEMITFFWKHVDFHLLYIILANSNRQRKFAQLKPIVVLLMAFSTKGIWEEQMIYSFDGTEAHRQVIIINKFHVGKFTIIIIIIIICFYFFSFLNYSASDFKNKIIYLIYEIGKIYLIYENLINLFWKSDIHFLK